MIEHAQLAKQLDQLFTKRNMSDLLQLKSFFFFFLSVNNKGMKGQTKRKTYTLGMIFLWKKLPNWSSATERRGLLYIFFNLTVY